MRITRTIICTIFLILCLCTITPILATEDIITKNTLVNVLRGAAQSISQDTAEALFFTTEFTFASNIKAIPYVTTESEISITENDSFFRYYHIKIDNANEITQIKLSYRLPRDNELKLTPISLKLFALSQDGKWVNIPHTVDFTTNTHYYFSSKTSFYETFALGDDTFTPTVTPNEIIVTEPEEETTPIVTQTKPDLSERVYIDDANEPNYILIIIIIVGITLAIGGTVTYVIAKHKIEPSQIRTVDNAALEMKIQEAVRAGKSDGEIVNDFLDQKYSLDSIVAELQKLGRSK